MKKIILLIGILSFGKMSSNAGTITVYGKNDGTDITISPDGTKTYKILCDNWYKDYKCYTIEDVPVQIHKYSQKLTIYSLSQIFEDYGIVTIEGQQPINPNVIKHTVSVRKN